MGRSRGNFHATDEDPTQRSRRKKNAPSGESSESASIGQGASDGKGALYHCNYCNKDITGRVRIKCFICPDFDLCVECFSVGAEITPHKSNHSYRVMDNLTFPLFCADWIADEEILLLEGIEMYGLWNWAEVAEHVGTKSKAQCIDHYTNVYINSPHFPLPDMSHVVGKNRTELLAMAKGNNEDKKGFALLGELTMKEESSSTPKVKVEDSHKGGSTGRLPSSISAEADSGIRSGGSNMPAISSVKKESNISQGGPSNIKVEAAVSQKGRKGKKTASKAVESPLVEMSGYNAKRHEFDPEYDNDAEHLLADMEFKDTDTPEEHELKLRVLRIYSRRLDERKRRKDFIIERNLLHPNPFEKDLAPDEIALCRQYDVFMRFHSMEAHNELLETVIGEHRTMKRINMLKEAYAAGCRTSKEADRWHEMKRKKEAEEKGQRGSEGARGSTPNVYMRSDSVPHPSNPVNAIDLLSDAEKRLCIEMRIHAPLYLRMQEVMTKEIFAGNVTKKSDAHHLFDCDTSKIDRIYDVLVKKGIAPP